MIGCMQTSYLLRQTGKPDDSVKRLKYKRALPLTCVLGGGLPTRQSKDHRAVGRTRSRFQALDFSTVRIPEFDPTVWGELLGEHYQIDAGYSWDRCRYQESL